MLICQISFKEKTSLNPFIINFRSYLVLCRPYISQCIDLKWKALTLRGPMTFMSIMQTIVTILRYYICV